MNNLQGKIQDILTSDSLSLVYISVNNCKITAIVIDTPKTNQLLEKGKNVTVIFKETEVIIGNGFQHEISMQNKFEGIIKHIETKNLLSKVTVSTKVGDIKSIITTNAVNKLQLTVNKEVTEMVKTNEIMLTE